MDTEIDTMEIRFSKAVLLREIEDAWRGLNEALARLSQEQLTQVRDPQGWAVKDHLVHMAAWERSVVVFLQGRARHEGLGIDEALYQTGDDDLINAAIQEKRKDVSPAEALADLRDVHAQLVSLVERMTDDDLHKANSEYGPSRTGEPGERDVRPIGGMIYSNTANHFRDHREWIESLVSQSS